MVMLNWFVRDPTPVLTGSRVVLRAPRARDYEAWRQLRRESREFLKPYEPRWTEADLNRQAFGARLIRGRKEAKRGTDFSFLIFDATGPQEATDSGDTLGLTPREAEVLRFLSAGFSNKEVARRLALSVRTVETHRLNLRRKTQTGRLKDLVTLARQLGLAPVVEGEPGRAARH